ncbi:hypothetical protein T310_5917 [Rasamsonia emersonii CBS 393.64]|uniref:Uncharacterized protein n=1 Tax=Rasamsonia emersonii (strain ATCC 16479 / CBS 393.64 / IMI 116815) TaxID=1408163 RepID=A0A0F4YR26_RASE3|nr:hypothetical protein T310_5917 [Rasamsonia emersonii CBS 393.64]KKA20088.1 hypothetical protein T310_5917 [Rasamsonia emersonii CBS 393.64]
MTSRPVSSKTGYNHQAYFRWTLHVDCAFTAVQSQDGVHEMVVASGMTAPDSIAERYRARASSFSFVMTVQAAGKMGPLAYHSTTFQSSLEDVEYVVSADSDKMRGSGRIGVNSTQQDIDRSGRQYIIRKRKASKADMICRW